MAAAIVPGADAVIIDAGRLNRLIAIERPVPGEGIEAAGTGSWAPVAQVWAEVEDRLPSRGEKFASGINIASRPARVRMYWRADVTPDMRFVMGDRVMQIIAGPAELGFREGLEFVVEDYSSAGGGA